MPRLDGTAQEARGDPRDVTSNVSTGPHRASEVCRLPDHAGYFAKAAKLEYPVTTLRGNPQTMNWSPILSVRRWLGVSFLLAAAVFSARAQNQTASTPVPYASISELNVLLAQVEQASQTSQLDLAKLRVDKWKADGASKHQTEANVESLSRNLQNALPEIIAQLRASPEDLSATFKLYRNLDALYDVFGAVVESAGAFGTKDEFQSLDNDLNSLERARRSLAERMETLSASKEAELNRLRTQAKTVQAATTNPTQPKKVIVDDTEPPKKPAKPVKKKPAPAQPPAAPPQ